MNIRSLSLVALLALAGLARAEDPFLSIRTELLDESRHRTVPVKIYYPKDLKAPAPIVIFSHGLGGSRDNYTYIGQYWAEHGYIAVHLQHEGSDDAVWKDARPAERMEALKKAANGENYVARIKDVKFTIDQLEQLNKDKDFELCGKLDLAKIAMAGHSFGAQTSQAIVGQIGGVMGHDISVVDPRVKCAVIMSPAPPSTPGQLDKAFTKINVPVYWMTGTKDVAPIGNTKAEDRRVPFDKCTAKDQYLLVLTDGDHGIFSGRRDALLRRSSLDYDKILPLIQKSSTAFLDAYLKGDDQQKTYLQTQFKADLGPAGTFEQK